MTNNIYKKRYITLLILMLTTTMLHAAQVNNSNTHPKLPYKVKMPIPQHKLGIYRLQTTYAAQVNNSNTHPKLPYKVKMPIPQHKLGIHRLQTTYAALEDALAQFDALKNAAVTYNYLGYLPFSIPESNTHIMPTHHATQTHNQSQLLCQGYNFNHVVHTYPYQPNNQLLPQQPAHTYHDVIRQCDTAATLEPQEYPILGDFIKEEALAPQSISPSITLTDLKHEAPQKKAKKHTCDQCGKSFPYKWYLKQHEIVHTDRKPWKCDYPECTKRYKRKNALVKHRLKEHKPRKDRVKKQKCDTCGYHAASRIKLKTHQRKHTGERPFECPTCHKTYKYKSSLIRHIKGTHQSSPKPSSSPPLT